MKIGFRKTGMGFFEKFMAWTAILMKKVGWEWDQTPPSEPSVNYTVKCLNYMTH